MAEAAKKRSPRKKPEEMTADERAAYEKRTAPKPAFVVYKLLEDFTDIDIVGTYRDANEVLPLMSKDSSLKYKTIEVK